MDAEVPMDGDAQPHPGPASSEDMADGDGSPSQGLPTGGTQVSERDPTMNDSAAHAKSSPPTEDKLLLIKRAMENPKKLWKSKSVSVLERCGNDSRNRKNFLVARHLSRHGGW